MAINTQNGNVFIDEYHKFIHTSENVCCSVFWSFILLTLRVEFVKSFILKARKHIPATIRSVPDNVFGVQYSSLAVLSSGQNARRGVPGGKDRLGGMSRTIFSLGSILM